MRKPNDSVTRAAASDQSVLNQIQSLASQEHQLYSKDPLSDEDSERLRVIQVELDRCWDLLRQREALRNAGKDPDKAQMRPASTVENYEQ